MTFEREVKVYLFSERRSQPHHSKASARNKNGSGQQRIDIMNLLKSIASSFDRAISKGPEAVNRHMSTVFRRNPSQWSRAVDKYSKKMGER